MKLSKLEIQWLEQPEDHNYPAAESYLTLIYSEKDLTKFISELRNAEITSFKAKDIFRASELSLLGVSNGHIKKNVKKIKEGKALSPILLVRDTKNGRVIIADGYHRLCTVYRIDEDAVIPCKIV